MERPEFLQEDFTDLETDWQPDGEAAVLLVRLNRPDAANAYTPELVTSLCRVLRLADADQAVRCIVLTGAGRSFCAGGDLKNMEKGDGMFAGEPDELRRRYRSGIQEIPRTFEYLETPVVAAVNGAAIGAGLDLACMCDLRIASDKARFGETFVRLGLIPGDAGTFYLQRVVGYAKAMELTLTGRVIDAGQALQAGLVNEVVAPATVQSRAIAVAAEIAANAPLAVALAKRGVMHGYHQSAREQLDMMAVYQGVAQTTADHREGVRAFLEKRPATFRGE